MPARILIVDDAAVVRRTLAAAVDTDPELALAGTAGTGLMALQMIPRVAPDLVVLDMEMPGMSGLDVLGEIRRRFVDLPVVMYASRTARTEADTVAALAAGAVDFVLKPAVVTDLGEALRRVGGGLLAKLKLIAADPQESSAVLPEVPRPRAAFGSGAVDVVAIGASTGGPNALAELLPELRGRLEVPVLIVQHMPAGFTAALARRLDAVSSLRVLEAQDGARLIAGEALLAPGDRHLEIVGVAGQPRIRLHDGPLVASCRPSVDALFRSLPGAFGANVLGVVMTGLGRDGLEGAQAIVAAGGRILTQDRESSVVWGMPGAVARAGLAESSLPIRTLAREIQRRVGRDPRRVR